MQIKIEKTALADALAAASSVVETKTSLPVLQNVKIEDKGGKLSVTGSDLDTTIRAVAECEVIEEGAGTIPAKLFSTAVSKMVNGALSIKVDGEKITMEAGTSKFRFSGIRPEEFPVLPEVEGESITIPATTLGEMLRKTAFAMAVDDTRRTLMGVYFTFGDGKITTVATDGRRLAIVDAEANVPASFDKKFILPKKTVTVLRSKLAKDGDVTLALASSQAVFSFGGITLTSKLVDDAYPNYRAVVPASTQSTAVVGRNELLGAIDRISVFVTDSSYMKLNITGSAIGLSSSDADVGEAKDEIPVKFDGADMEMTLNPVFVKEALNAIDEDEIEVHLNDGKSPAVINPVGGGNYTYVVMPLRV